MRALGVALERAFEQLLMFGRRGAAEDHCDHEIADIFVEYRGMRIEQYT